MSICYCKTVVHGESRWAAVSVVRILQNEKYKGDLLMQKYYIRDFLTKELEKNDGKLTQYYVENDHEAIIEREIWDAAQLVSTERKSSVEKCGAGKGERKVCGSIRGGLKASLLGDREKDIAQGNALERLRAAQMKELTEKYPDWFQVAKNTRMVIGEIIIGGDKGCEILFMDGVRLVTD
ncbi:MAG: recombinase family protein [Blautia faecis]